MRNNEIQLIKSHPDKEWDWDLLSRDPKIIEVVRAHPDKPWNWYHISEFATMDLVAELPDKPWCWQVIASGPNMPMEMIITICEFTFHAPWNRHQAPQFIFANIKSNTSWYDISSNANLNITDIKKYTNKLSFEYVSENANINAEEVVAHPYNWNWDKLYRNANIAAELFAANIDKLNSTLNIWYTKRRIA